MTHAEAIIYIKFKESVFVEMCVHITFFLKVLPYYLSSSKFSLLLCKMVIFLSLMRMALACSNQLRKLTVSNPLV